MQDISPDNLSEWVTLYKDHLYKWAVHKVPDNELARDLVQDTFLAAAEKMDGAIQFVANDLTNDESKAKSAVELKKYGLDQIIENYKGTGMVFFFNPGTSELITEISIGKSDDEIAEAMILATDGV